MSRFAVSAAGIEVTLPTEEVDLLAALPRMLEAVGEHPADPAGPRLFQSPYPDDPLASVEYEMESGARLADGRTADREVFTRTLPRAVAGVLLSDDEAEAWMRVVGDARLALAARLGVESDEWESRADEPTFAVLHYLTFVQHGLVEALMHRLDH